MSPFVFAIAGFGTFAILPRALWSVGVAFIACAAGIVASSALNDRVFDEATMVPFWLGLGAFVAGVFQLVRRGLSPIATRWAILLAFAAVMATVALTFWFVLQVYR